MGFTFPPGNEIKVQRGHPEPLGARIGQEGGINFALFSEHAISVTLCLFYKETAPLEIELDPIQHRTGYIWHILIYGLPPEVEYGYRVNGKISLESGLVFDSSRILLDPYAKSVTTPSEWGKGNQYEKNLKGRILPIDSFDWENDKHPLIPMGELIIYEMHVRGFTKDASSKVKHPGSFLGVIEKIPYLLDLGVNAVELQPIHEFNECEYKIALGPNQRLFNYWGYSSVNFFSPMNRYATSNQKEAALTEFKTMVKELHKAGIEVILDVVFNHTSENDQTMFSMRGIDNKVYYMIGPDGKYLNYTGCGNTINANHAVVRKLILDVLRYYVSEMHVDGFRFDLASALTRGEHGTPLPIPPLIESIYYDPQLSNTKLIAEAWDAAGLYQVGKFPSKGRWAEWNDKYRDTVRRFIKGDLDSVGNFATCLSGSEDIYGKERTPLHSINFVTCHDGFTLRDLVSYNQKHNENNREENRDGISENYSWNCGVEGDTQDLEINTLRERQMRNFIFALFVSLGTPMVLMGDEYGHTRSGNNNAWCQDNQLNWFLWDRLEKNYAFYRFFKEFIHFYKKTPLLRRKTFLTDEDVDWHGPQPFKADWSPSSRFLALTLKDKDSPLYIAFNADHIPLEIELPQAPAGKGWARIVDTSLPSPDDLIEDPIKRPLLPSKYTLHSHTALLAVAK